MPVRSGFTALFLAVAPSLLWAQYVPPIGIPAPSFGINEQAGATTLVVTGTQAIPNPIPAGSVIEIQGTYTRAYKGSAALTCNGTVTNPSFVRGAIGSKIAAGFEVRGSYCIFENLDFEPGGFLVKAPADHVAFRGSEVTGTPTSGGTAVVNWVKPAADVHDVVFFNNQIHDNGDWQITTDQDVHGTQVGRSGGPDYGSTYNIWILENTYYHNSGTGVQVIGNNLGYDRLHHIYVGKNVAHHNKQVGFSSKQASDVIFSRNVAYSHRPSPSSVGAGLHAQYGPNRVWFLYNKIYDSDIGIRVASNSNSSLVESQIYLIGNVAWNIHSSDAPSGGAGYQDACWSIWGGITRYTINNTCHDADSGYRTPSSGVHFISGNIFSLVGAAQYGEHLYFGGSVSEVTATRSLTDEPLRSSHPICPSCIVGSPAYVDAPNGDFHLTAVSAAIDATVEESVYATFQSLYGLDIRKDFAGRTRPLGPAWDIGAHEYDPGNPIVILFSDDFETASGWTTNPNGSDTATSGAWEQGDPDETIDEEGVKQLHTTVSGVNDLVTGRVAGASANIGDVDSGITSIVSPAIALPAAGNLTLTFQYYLAHWSCASSDDYFRVQVVGPSGTTTVFESLGAASNRDGAWTPVSVSLNSFAGQSIRILFEAADLAGGSLVEAGVDDVTIAQQ